jgi:hypothetical protein
VTAEGVDRMCYECTCGKNYTVMSDDSITEETFRKAAAGGGITLREAKENAFKLLKKELGHD